MPDKDILVTIKAPAPSSLADFTGAPPEYPASATVDLTPFKMCYQIGDGPMNAIDISTLAATTGGTVNFTLTEDDCPVACNTPYSLVVYAYNADGSYLALSDFQRRS
jgi:hypothetical protein